MGPSFVSRLFATDLAVDLGTSNTLIFARGQGVVLQEPSIIATAADGSVLAAGAEAKAMLGREPGSVTVMRPIRNGVVAEPDLAQKMLETFLARLAGRWPKWIRPRVIVTVPSGITQVERRAVRDLVQGAGAREVYVVTEAFAAAVGAGIPIQEAHGNIIVTIGGGTTEVALLSLSGVVHCESVRTGGDEMDDAIVQWVRKHHSLLIGALQAENIKLSLGSARAVVAGRELAVKGRAIIEGLPRTITLTDEEVAEALRESVVTIVDAVRACLERTPPELAGDIVERGLVVAGGGALLPLLDDVLHEETGLPVAIAEEPLACAALGAGKMLEDVAILKRIAADLSGAPTRS
jgi:rod shape-determining protein MreB